MDAFPTELVWGCADGCRLKDGRTGRVFEFSASGRISLALRDAGIFRERLLHARSVCTDAEELRFFLSEIMRITAKTELVEAVSESGLSFDELYEARPRALQRLSSVFYGKMQSVFAEYGLAIMPACEHTLITNFVIIDR